MATPTKIAINGFGRIGRKVLRLALSQSDVEIVGINDLTTPEQMVHLLKYDSVHGTLRDEVRLEDNFLHVGGQKIRLSAEKDPTALPWKDLGAQVVHECTGIFTKREKAAAHLQAGARRVIISAPSGDADKTLCMGVNHHEYDPSQHEVVSNASCTTNCLAPVAKVIDEAFGIERGTMLTVHSYTNDQRTLDLPHKDPRRARAAAVSMIPTTTGAAKAVGLVLPQLNGKLDGLAIRVPTPNVSLVDFTAVVKTDTSKEKVNQAIRDAAQNSLKGVLGYCEEPLVSVDYNGTTESSTVDAALTTVLEGTMVKVITWYDNESGFSQRMLDLTTHIASKGI